MPSALHAPSTHLPAMQPPLALGGLQARLQPPQLLGSTLRSKPSSTLPSQLLSVPSHSSPSHSRVPGSQIVFAGQSALPLAGSQLFTQLPLAHGMPVGQ